MAVEEEVGIGVGCLVCGGFHGDLFGWLDFFANKWRRGLVLRETSCYILLARPVLSSVSRFLAPSQSGFSHCAVCDPLHEASYERVWEWLLWNNVSGCPSPDWLHCEMSSAESETTSFAPLRSSAEPVWKKIELMFTFFYFSLQLFITISIQT